MQPGFLGFLSKTKCTAIFGASTFSLGIILLFLKTWLLELLTASLLVLKPHSSLEDAWRKMPIPIPTDVYFLNWTNPEEFHNVSTKPKFEEVGPYRFMQNMEKVNVVWNDNNTVTFNQVRSWYFNEEYTNGSLTDEITTMNIIALSTAHHIRNWNYFMRKAASAVIETMTPEVHVTKTVNQYLFEGYDDFFVKLYNYLPFIASDIPRYDKFGWFLMRNASETFDGVFNMGNGVDGDFDIHNWNYHNTTPYFTGSCAKVHGSGGELYSAKPSKDYIGIFFADMCRYLRFDFEEEVMVDGILGYKYSIGNGVLDNGTLIPENKCYCAGECIPSGMINVSSCRYGLPTFASLPNFYGADPVYLNAVDGLQPEKVKHEVYIVLEPETAIPLLAVGRLQLNFFVHPMEDISVYQNVPEMFFPLFWVQQKATLPGYVVAALKIYLRAPLIIIGAAIILITIGLYLLIFLTFKSTLISLYKKKFERIGCVPLRQEEVPLQHDVETAENSDIKFVKQNNCT